MNKIKWTGPKHYPDFGVCETGQIVTEDQISHEVMEKWVSQGMAEWMLDPTGEGKTTITITNKKGRKAREA